MSKKPEALTEADVISHVAKDTRPADTVYNEIMDTFNRVAKQVKLDPADAARFRRAFSSVVSKRTNEEVVTEVYDSLREFIINSLWHNQPVELRGLVAFRLFERNERKSHNLHTGEKISIPRRQTVRAVKLADLRRITADLDDNGNVYREGDHPTVEARRQRDQLKQERRRERERRERRIQEARQAEREAKQLERKLEKARQRAEERRVLAERFDSEM